MLLALVSFSSVCFGTLMRIGLITQSGETIYMIGDYYDERHNTIKTPFDYINEAISVQFEGQEGLMVKEVTDQPELLEYINTIPVPDCDPAILRMALSFIIGPRHGMRQLEQQTVTQLLNIYSYLRASQSIIDMLIERSVDLAIDDPVQCSFGDQLPSNAHRMIENGYFIRIARQRVAQIFAETLPSSKWVEEQKFKIGNSITSIAFSPDGRYLAIAPRDGTVRIWDMQTYEQTGEPIRHNYWISSVAFSHDGKYLATGSHDGTARIWDAQTHEQIGKTLKSGLLEISIAFSPDGKYLATSSSDRSARIWDMQTYEQIGEPIRHNYWISSVAFSPNGKYLATGSHDGTARIWDVQTHEQIGESLRHDDDIRSVAFSPNGKYLATGSHDGTARIWDVQTHEQIGEPLRHDNGIRSVAFSPDGKYLATGSYDGTTRIWDTQTHEQTGEPLRHNTEVKSVIFSPDGSLLVTGSDDGFIHIWQQEWNWPNWPISYHGENTDYTGNLLKQLLILKILRNARLTPDEINDLRPIYNKLPKNAQRFVNELTRAFRQQNIFKRLLACITHKR